MKTCPVCQSSFSDLVRMCPYDQIELLRYDLRADLRARREAAAFAPKGSLIFLLTEERFTTRLSREIKSAAMDFRQSPRAFLRSLFASDADRRYRRAVGVSFAIAITGLSSCFTLGLLIFGLLRPATATTVSEGAPHKQPESERDKVITWINVKTDLSREGRKSSGSRGGSKQERQPSHGGGGGGAKTQLASERGAPPPAALQPQVTLPSPVAPKIEHPSLVVPATVYADPRSFPPQMVPIGDPFGRQATNAAGPGVDGGMGNGLRGGVGPGDGPGLGPGFDGGVGGRRFSPSGGPPTGFAGSDEIPWASGRLKPTIVYKEKARYTEAARQNQVQGTVVLRATFSADGRITDIRVVRGLPMGLTENAIMAAQRIRFQPAIRNGVPITVNASLEFNFALY